MDPMFTMSFVGGIVKLAEPKGGGVSPDWRVMGPTLAL